MKQTLVQLAVGLIGLSVLIWGEAKHYIQANPEVLSTWQLIQTQRMQPIQYFMYQVAYDPNTGKTWYLYNDGFWYDKPPKIRKRENQGQAALGDVNGTSGGSVYNHGQPAQASANTTRY
jgi:hypothetical protein